MSDRATRAWCTSYRAEWVMPIAAPPIRDGAVVVEGDRIVWVGRAGDEPARFAARRVELGDAVLAPGIVNAHSHLDLTVLHGLLDGLSFFAWIRGVIACRAEMRPDEFLDSARAGIIEGLRHGVTTFGDTAPVTAPFDAMRELGVRGIAYQEFFGPDPAVVADAMAGIRAHVEALRKSETPLVKVGISPHAPFTVSEPLYRAAAEYARAERLPLATHIAESAAEDDFVRRGAGEFADLLRARGIALGPTARSPVALLERADVLGASALLIHAIRCDADDVQAIARSRSAVVTCPLSNRYFGHGVAPMAAYRAAGVTLGAGSDSLASNSTLDILEESRTALAGVAGATAADQWALATRGGAAALGLSGEIGTLEAGKAADFAVFPCAPSHQPPEPPVRRRAALVVVAGVERVRDGEVIGDVQDTLARAAAATARLREWRLRSTPG